MLGAHCLDRNQGEIYMALRVESAVSVLVSLWVAAVLQGLNPSLDAKGFRVHNIIIVGLARQPDRSLESQVSQPKFGTSQSPGCAILSLFGIGGR
jgi:hypothetical protein